MGHHRDAIRRLGIRISKIVHFDASAHPRDREYTIEEVRAFRAEIAASGADIGGGPYPSRRSVAYRGPEHPIEGPWRNGKFVDEPTPARRSVSHAEDADYERPQPRSVYSRRYQQEIRNREQAQWEEQQAQEQQQRLYERNAMAEQMNQCYVVPAQQIAVRRSHAACVTNSQIEWAYDPKPQRARARPASVSESQATTPANSKQSIPEWGHFSSPEDSDSSSDSDQEYVNGRGEPFPKRKYKKPHHYLERIYMHEPGFTGRLVVLNP